MSLRTLTSALLIAGSLAMMPSVSQGQEDQPLTPKQQDAVKKMIHDYILENPSIITEAIEALRQKEELAAETDAKKALVDRKADIFEDPESPVLGNVKGDVTVVEFFDYRCPYCKAMTDQVLDTVKSDGKVRLVMKELPILGPDSVTAARAALAARNQKKYEEFHRALMKLKTPVNEAALMKTAAEVGLNVEKLKKDMEDDKIDTVLKNNIQLAHTLNVTGTPAFIIGDQIVPGAMNQQAFKQMIDQARKPKS
ncbi:MAG: DsbA family protein [Telmatospirillum sp.]|nr:DsbA family protein [Telmatospirillum sp.]